MGATGGRFYTTSVTARVKGVRGGVRERGKVLGLTRS